MKSFLIKLLISLLIGSFFLWWVFKNINLQELFALSAQINFTFVLLGIGAYGGAIFIRALRWRTLLFPFVSLHIRQVLKALIVGYAMNVILPARLGELFRVNICKKWYDVSRSTALATIVWERVSDGIIVVSCLIIGSLAMGNVHNQNEIMGLMIGGVAIFLSALMGLFLLRTFSLDPLLKKLPRLQIRVHFFQKGIQEISSSALLKVMTISLVVWTFEGIALWSIVKATGISLDLSNVFLLIGIVSLSTLLPSPPGFLGTMQFAFSIALLASGYLAVSGVLAATMTQIFFLGSLTLVGTGLLLLNSLLTPKLNPQRNE